MDNLQNLFVNTYRKICSTMFTETCIAKFTENCFAIFAETNFSNNSVRRVITGRRIFFSCIDYRLTSVLDPDLESEYKKSKMTHKKRKVK